jgi:hypothetical protein
MPLGFAQGWIAVWGGGLESQAWCYSSQLSTSLFCLETMSGGKSAVVLKNSVDFKNNNKWIQRPWKVKRCCSGISFCVIQGHTYSQ